MASIFLLHSPTLSKDVLCPIMICNFLHLRMTINTMIKKKLTSQLSVISFFKLQPFRYLTKEQRYLNTDSAALDSVVNYSLWRWRSGICWMKGRINGATEQYRHCFMWVYGSVLFQQFVCFEEDIVHLFLYLHHKRERVKGWNKLQLLLQHIPGGQPLPRVKMC